MSALQRKIAVITGGSTGIELATAKRFVKEGAYTWTADLTGKGIRANVINPAPSRHLYSKVNLARTRKR